MASSQPIGGSPLTLRQRLQQRRQAEALDASDQILERELAAHRRNDQPPQPKRGRRSSARPATPLVPTFTSVILAHSTNVVDDDASWKEVVQRLRRVGLDLKPRRIQFSQEVGVSAQTVDHWQKGLSRPRFANLPPLLATLERWEQEMAN